MSVLVEEIRLQKKSRVIQNDGGESGIRKFCLSISTDDSNNVEPVEKKTLEDLPLEILSHILYMLPTYKDNLTARLVNKRWNLAAKDLKLVQSYFKIGVPWKNIEKRYHENAKPETGLHWVDHQPHLRPPMRNILLDWLVEVHNEFSLNIKTLFLSIAYLDRLLICKPGIFRHRFQLYGLTCLWVASKFEDLYSNSIRDLVWICDDAYTRNDFEDAEKEILESLNWNLAQVTIRCFMDEYMEAEDDATISQEDQNSYQELARLLAELCLSDYVFLRMYVPSVIATSAIFIARHTILGGTMPNWLIEASGYDTRNEKNCPVKQCVSDLCAIHITAYRTAR